ncbi:hypothetical protein M8J75_001895 [Diaphorina citri]|nr:hypothetical protein M8J75_001895 [Diaphorina citri]
MSEVVKMTVACCCCKQVVELLGLVTVAPRVGLGFRGGGKGGGTDPVVEVVAALSRMGLGSLDWKVGCLFRV